MLAPWKKSYDKPRHPIKKHRHHFANKDPYSQSSGFSSSHICMWELNHKEGWALKNWYFQIVVLEKTLESLLDCKEIKPVNPKGNQPWIFIGRADAEVEAPIFWPLDAKSQLIGKDPEVGKDWRQEEKRAAEDEMVRWHHLLNGQESEPAPGDSEGQGSLEHCSPQRVGHDLVIKQKQHWVQGSVLCTRTQWTRPTGHFPSVQSNLLRQTQKY